ncbi:helix-turn-helix transcriptional regulator [Stenotrophomonas mori]|uniref:AraC family transcriptional regulator n=1 Tax=Stenotrophomonas mori TaxID=2871096 RepID=A0ABT0SF88_9GAMM|nr:AraC family transcriptional regulator [Stenotrophomonas mori]MCL7713988.1 AraC family transcriptional regulator [Stenotrophomonas mori]
MHASTSHLRSYPAPTGLERHDYAQWVLPVRGELQLEVAGAAGHLDRLQGAFVAPAQAHDMQALDENCCLIVDCPAGLLDDATLDHLCRHPWLSLPAALRQRLQGLPERGVHGDPVPYLLYHFAPAGSGARLQALCLAITAAPCGDWTVARMAALVGVSGSRLHALFAREFGLPPLAWASAARLRWAKQQLLEGRAAIGDIALRAGYSEQSALTRALRRETGLTPRQWRARRPQ